MELKKRVAKTKVNKVKKILEKHQLQVDKTYINNRKN